MKPAFLPHEIAMILHQSAAMKMMIIIIINFILSSLVTIIPMVCNVTSTS
jgi:hypothetical protein